MTTPAAFKMKIIKKRVDYRTPSPIDVPYNDPWGDEDCPECLNSGSSDNPDEVCPLCKGMSRFFNVKETKE